MIAPLDQQRNLNLALTQTLKPRYFIALYGTTEVVPSRKVLVTTQLKLRPFKTLRAVGATVGRGGR